MRRYAVLLIICAQLYGCWQKEAYPVVFSRLTVDHQVSPLGIDNPLPRFGWRWQTSEGPQYQLAYQIIAASTKEALTPVSADLWNSGKVNDVRSQGVAYKGKPFKSKQWVYWKVRIWDDKGQCSNWSEIQKFCIGMLKESDWEADWISHRFAEVSHERGYFGTYEQERPKNPGDTAAIWMRRTIEVGENLMSGMAWIAGLGYYELFINGNKVGSRVMDPVFSDYQKSIYYATYDVSRYLTSGKNDIEVLLGNGFYNSPTEDLFMMDQAHWKSPPKLLFHLELDTLASDPVIVVSDTSWQWRKSHIVWNSIRGGETIDRRISRHPAAPNAFWPVKTVPAPLGQLRAQQMAPMREVETIEPIDAWELPGGALVYDFGKNITGYVNLMVSGCKVGESVALMHNEVLTKDSAVHIAHSSGHTRGRFQEGRLICGTVDTNIFDPRFTYHGFRYVQVEGVHSDMEVLDIEAILVHTDLPGIGAFTCSDTMINQLHEAVKRTLLNSVHGMPGEEPTREKMGWTFDAGMATMESYLFNFDVINTYEKYLQDLVDGQEDNGHIPPIVPTNGWGFVQPLTGEPVLYDDPWWGSTIFFVAEKLFSWTVDTGYISHAYPAMEAYFDFVLGTADDNLIVDWSLGDWLDLKQNATGWGPGLTPVEQTSTACLFWMAKKLAKYSIILGLHDRAEAYEDMSSRIKYNFNEAFLNAETGWYADSSQTAQALPLYLGLVPEKSIESVYRRLRDAIEWNGGHISTGFVGVQPLLHVLPKMEDAQLAFEMISKRDSPGWLHMINNGAQSTLGENLNAQGYGTGHHPFGACVGHWFYQYILGIRVGEAGWQSFYVEPHFIDSLEWAEGSYVSPYGEIVVKWRRTDNHVQLQLEIPPNSSATLAYPDGRETQVGVGHHVFKIVDYE